MERPALERPAIARSGPDRDRQLLSTAPDGPRVRRLRAAIAPVLGLFLVLPLVLGGWLLGGMPAARALPLASVVGDPVAAPLLAGLPVGNPITDGRALLRYALPIDNDAARKVQSSIEDMSDDLRGKRWSPINRKAKTAKRVLEYKREELLADVPAERRSEMEARVDEMLGEVEAIQDAVKARDVEAIWIERRKILDAIGKLEASMVTEFPFEIPEEFADRPLLKGRATVELETEKGVVTVVVDGYSAPVTAGNFVDLVERGFYDGLPFIRAEDFYVLQFGDPPGKEQGFINPKTGEYRAIPLEILVQGDEEPIYGFTLEQIGRYGDLPVLPFSAYGALAVARPEPDPNGGSSQMFFFLFESELTPAGANLLDGRYAVFGYAVDGVEVLGELRAGDEILDARVVDGLENFSRPDSA